MIMGRYLKDFYTKFDCMLTDSLSVIKILEKERFDQKKNPVHDSF